MNLFVADPEWGSWIILYFFLGGLAAGAYFVAALIELIGTEADRVVARAGYRIAFPLVAVCGLLLTVDLERPERFWHMLLQSQVVEEALAAGWPWTGAGWGGMVQAPMLKTWSPMSVGAWALFVFGGFSLLSFLGSLWPDGWLERLLHRRWLGHLFQLAGSGVGFFVASYTGALLTASNQPLWSRSDWIAPLFLTSAASTGIAVLLLLGGRSKPTATIERLERADLWAVGLEAILFVIFLVSLGPSLRIVWQVWQGKLLLIGVPVLGLLVPLALHLGRGRAPAWRMPAAAVTALIGGFLLRYAIVLTPPALLAHAPELTPTVVQIMPPSPEGTPPAWFSISPEDGRLRGGGPGTGAGNRAGTIVPRSKVIGASNP